MALDVSEFRARCLQEALRESATRLNKQGEDPQFSSMFGKQHPLTYLTMTVLKGYWRGETSLQSLVIADTLKVTKKEEIDRKVTAFMEPFDYDCKDFETCCMMSFLLPPTQWIPMVQVITPEERLSAVPDDAWEEELLAGLPDCQFSRWVVNAITTLESQWKIFLAAKPDMGGTKVKAYRDARTKDDREILEHRYRFIVMLIMQQLVERLNNRTHLQAFERAFWGILKGDAIR